MAPGPVAHRPGADLTGASPCQTYTPTRRSGRPARAHDQLGEAAYRALDVIVMRAAAELAMRRARGHLTLEPIAVPDRALRAPGVAAAVTLADKVAAYCRLNGIETLDPLRDKLARLEHGDATTLLADVAASPTPEETRQPAPQETTA